MDNNNSALQYEILDLIMDDDKKWKILNEMLYNVHCKGYSIDEVIDNTSNFQFYKLPKNEERKILKKILKDKFLKIFYKF
jgi:hypothetical protein